MAIPVIETSTTNTEAVATTTITLTKPTGVAADDLLVIIVGSDTNGTPGYQALSGFTQVWGDVGGGSGTGADAVMYWRIATGSEGASETVTNDNSAEMVGWYLRISGVDTTTPINVSGTMSEEASGSTHTADSVTTTAADCLAFYIDICDGSDTDPFTVSGTGWTEFSELAAGNSSTSVAGSIGTKDQTTAGATGNATITLGGNADSGVAVQFAVAPTGGASGTTITVPTGPWR